MDESIYITYGYKSRDDYLESLADEFGISKTEVLMLAEILGSNEDFDGLIAMLEDEYE